MKLGVGLTAVSLLLIFSPVCLAAGGRYAQKLFRDLFMNYTSALRPVNNTDHAINVTLQVTLSQIIDMDERNQILTLYLWVRQVWMDSFLTWSKEDYDGLDSIRIPSRYVWKPDIVLYNSADDEFSSSMETNVVLRSDGQVTWDQPSITKSSCSVDVAYFPFDLQQCILTYGSWTHNGNQMDLHIELQTADLADLVPNVEWQVLGMPAKKNVILYGCCSDPYPDITFTLQLKRRASFYIFNLLLPCMMISFLAPLGFYLPADSGEKVSLGVTVLLALTVFQLLVAESMPPSESVPLIGKYYIATMTMVTASTALTILIMNLHHCGPEARPVPDWVRVLVLRYLNRLCLVYELGETCTRENPAPKSQEVTRKQCAHSWEVNGDHHTAAAEEDNCNHLKPEELSVTIESCENTQPITVQRVERLTQAKDTILTAGLQEIRNSTIYKRPAHQDDSELRQQGFQVENVTNAKENGPDLGRGKLEQKMSKDAGGEKGEGFKMAAVREEKKGTGTGERYRDGELREKSREKSFQDGGHGLVEQKKESGDRGELAKPRSVPEDHDLELNGKTERNNAADSDKCPCCHCCLHVDVGLGKIGGCHGDRPWFGFHGDASGCSGLRGEVASIAASFQEQRAAQALMADWRKVAKVMDRALMWIFFIMVFIMSVLILGKAI